MPELIGLTPVTFVTGCGPVFFYRKFLRNSYAPETLREDAHAAVRKQRYFTKFPHFAPILNTFHR